MESCGKVNRIKTRNKFAQFYRRWFEIRRVMPILWSGTIEFCRRMSECLPLSAATERSVCYVCSIYPIKHVNMFYRSIVSFNQWHRCRNKSHQSTQAEQSDALKTVSTQDLQLSPWQTLFAWVDVAEAKQ